MAYDRLEPWGPKRMDFGFASVMALYANMYLREGAARLTAADFMPDFLTDPNAKAPTLTPEQQQEALLRMAQAAGAVVMSDGEDDDESPDGDYGEYGDTEEGDEDE